MTERMIEKTPVFIDMAVNLEKLEDFVNLILPIDQEVEKLRKERENWGSATKTVEEIKKEVIEVIENDLLKAVGSLTEVVKRAQERKDNVVPIINVLRNWQAWKNLLKHLDLIPKTDLTAINQTVRNEKVAECEQRILELQKKKSSHFRYGDTGIFQKEERYVQIWRMTAPNFENPVDAGGRWLDENNPTHKRLLVLYKKLKLDEIIPKLKLYRPFVDKNNREHALHPGYFYEE